LSSKNKTFTRLHVRLDKPGKASQEWRFDRPKKVSAGYLMENHLWLPIPGIDPSVELIEWKQGKLCVRITKNHQGHILLGNEKVSLSTWREQKTTFEKNGVYLLPLETHVSATLGFGQHQLNLWITEPPTSDKVPSFWPQVRTLLSAVPKMFVAMFVVSALLHVALLEALKLFPALNTVMPPTIEKSFRNISVAELGKVDKNLQEQLEKAASMGIKIGGNKISRPPQPIDATGYIQAITSTTPSNKSGSFSSLFTTQSFTKDLGKALSGKSFGDVMNAQMKALNNNSFASALGNGEPGKGSGGGPALYGVPSGQLMGNAPTATTDLSVTQKALPSGQAPSSPPTGKSGPAEGSLDQSAISRVINSRRFELDACYEAALLGQSGLRGKATVFFNIVESGNAANVRVETDSLQNKSFQNCLIQRISTWTFNKPKGGSVPVKLPLIFSPSGKN